MNAIEMIKRMPDVFLPESAEGVDATIQFLLSEPMHAIIRETGIEVIEGEADDPDVSLEIDDEDFVALMKGELSGMTAFMTGQLKIKGNLMLAQKLTSFFDTSGL